LIAGLPGLGDDGGATGLGGLPAEGPDGPFAVAREHTVEGGGEPPGAGIAQVGPDIGEVQPSPC